MFLFQYQYQWRVQNNQILYILRSYLRVRCFSVRFPWLLKAVAEGRYDIDLRWQEKVSKYDRASCVVLWDYVMLVEVVGAGIYWAVIIEYLDKGIGISS